MPRPTSRVLALLEILQAGGTYTVTELAERLPVDRRTVRRYVEHLRELDIPVESIRGRYGGYRLAAHAHMPPLMLTDSEAVATVWALLEAAEVSPNPAGALAATTALAKIRRVLPPPLVSDLDAVVETVSFAPTAAERAQRVTAHPPPEHDALPLLLQLTGAARNMQVVRFAHTSRYGRCTQREVHPYGIVAHRGRLYLAAYDPTRSAPRSFRLDRISHLAVLRERFRTREDLDPVGQVLGPLGPSPTRSDVIVRIQADLTHIRSRIPEMLAAVTVLPPGPDHESGWSRVFLRAERLQWVLGNLVILDRPFIIDEPDELRVLATELARTLARTADAVTERVASEAWSRSPRIRTNGDAPHPGAATGGDSAVSS